MYNIAPIQNNIKLNNNNIHGMNLVQQNKTLNHLTTTIDYLSTKRTIQ